MAKKPNPKNPEKKSYGRAAVKETANDLAIKRRARRRKPGDGKGVDPGLDNCFGILLESHLAKLSPETKKRMHKHISHHVDQAMVPLSRLMSKAGNEFDIKLFNDIGINMFRPILEFLESEESSQT